MRQPSRRRRANGFSIIEALIAAAILLLVAIGVLPLFVRAMTNNVSGSESTRVSNFSKTGTETLAQLHFGSAGMTPAAATFQYWEDPNPAIDGDEAWVVTPTSGLEVTWRRSVAIRQYATSAFDDGLLEASEALPVGTPTEFIHFKEIEVRVEPVYRDSLGNIVVRTGGVLDPPPSITTRFSKSL
jgi:type II secretory pathway pseudopilin PulG